MKKAKTELAKVPVSVRALFIRVNRRLRHEGQSLRKCKPGSRGYSDCGDYYITDDIRNGIEATHQDLETLAKELGVLRPFEMIVE